MPAPRQPRKPALTPRRRPRPVPQDPLQERQARRVVLALAKSRRSICRRDLLPRLDLTPMRITKILQRLVADGLLAKHGGSTWAYYTLPDDPNPSPPATMANFMRNRRLDKINESRRRRGLPPLRELPDW